MCGMIVAGLILSESGVCEECPKISPHTPENVSWGATGGDSARGISATSYSFTSSITSSSSSTT